MAAVLDALGPYVKKLITDMAQEEVSMLLGVSGEIEKLEDNMENIKAFLADAERRRITEQSVQRWVRKLKDAMYDATDILDICQLEAYKRRHSTEDKVPGCLKSLIFCLRNPMVAHKIGSRIKELNQRLDSIHKEAYMFKFNIKKFNINLSSNSDAEHSSSLNAMSEFDETAIVGENVEKDTKELAQVLITDDNHDLKVVSIVGMGGMGKTTLAQKIFNETTIQEHFKIRIWLSITQNFDEAELLRSTITYAGGHNGGEKDKSELVQTLTDILSVSKFLLVMDDVWEDSAWDHVLSVPIKNACRKQPGSRVLVTTRFEDLALKMQASLHQHHVRPLDGEDAWSLLKKQLHLDQEINHLKSIGMEILKRCDGLPLAIKVIGGMLSTKYPSHESEWKAVLNSPAWSVDGLHQELDKRLYLSYEDMAPQLKQCFLYCSLFPKGTSIPREVVISMWISEGFIQPSGSSYDDDRLENIAAEYFRGLIKRNLIQPEEGYSLTGYMCTMHDVVRSFAEYMATEESVVVVQDRETATCDGSSNGMLIRRLSVEQTVSAVEWVVLQKQNALRTLIINSSINYQSGDSLESFSKLRVLYISYAETDRLVASLTKLKHLRYLHLKETDISWLPDDIQQMKFLQYINLLQCEKLSHLPSSIVNLVHLRSLDITGSHVSDVPKGFGGLTNLRVLKGFPVHVDDMDHAGSSSWCSLQELAHLSQLRKLTLYGLEQVAVSSMAEKAMISGKAHLSYLELNYNNANRHTATRPTFDGGESEQQQLRQQSVTDEEVLEKLCPPTRCLETLRVTGGYAGRQLPNWLHAPASATHFKSLRFLGLESLPRCTQLPDGLCCLPCLEVLIIKDAPAIKRIGPEFQAPSSLPPGVTAAALVPPFPKLRDLQLIGLCQWEEWEWNNQGYEEQQGSAKAAIAMPCLERLEIQNCKLNCLPTGLASINRPALRRLHLYDLTNLTSVDNFPSVVALDVFYCPMLKRISGLSSLQKLRVVRCPNLEVLEGVPSLDSLVKVQLGSAPDKTMMVSQSSLQMDHGEWILDCSVRMHYTSNVQLLDSTDLITHDLMDDDLHILGRGSVRTERFKVPGVRYIAGDARNVISVAQLADDHGLVTIFEPAFCYVKDRATGQIVGQGHLRDGVYVLKTLRISQDKGAGGSGLLSHQKLGEPFQAAKAEERTELDRLEQPRGDSPKRQQMPSLACTVDDGTTTMGSPSSMPMDPDEWILDTRASSHRTSNPLFLLGGDDALLNLGHGLVHSKGFEVPDVSYVKGEATNVISVTQLASSHGLATVFEPTGCYTKNKKTGEIVGRGHLCDGVYVLDNLLIGQDRGGGQAVDGRYDGRTHAAGGGGDAAGGGRFGDGRDDGRTHDGGERGGHQDGGGAGGGRDKGNGGQAGGGGGDQGGDGGNGEEKEEKNGDKNEEEKEDGEKKEEKKEGGEEEESSRLSFESLCPCRRNALSMILSGACQCGPGLLSRPYTYDDTIAEDYVLYNTPQGGPPPPPRKEFFMDTGAAHHMTWNGNPDFLNRYPEHIKVQLPIRSVNGIGDAKCDVIGCGYINTDALTLEGVLLVPTGGANLVSISKLTTDYKVRVVFDEDMFLIKRLENKQMIGSGHREGGHYILNHFKPKCLYVNNLPTRQPIQPRPQEGWPHHPSARLGG